jgi:hypothetical protein
MSRLLLAAALLCAALSGSTAQEKKQPPKKKERIAIADPRDAAKDPDFAVQGEYEGKVTFAGQEEKVGVQVVAKGRGAFDVKVLKGGLPGAGWDARELKKYTATTDGDKATVRKQDQAPVGTIAGGSISITHDGGTFSAVRVHRKSKSLGEKPPAGAVVLFGKEGDETNWNGGKIVELSDGKFLNVGIKSKESFGAFKAHIEFRTPWMPNSTGQGRGNSGVYIQDRYECQVLDSFGLSGENNECGGIYTQHKPLVNMCLPPLSWQTYDIEFTPAVFEGDRKVKNARATISHNGVKIHDNVEFPKECPGGQKEAATPGPFQFQNHGDPVVYRNVWVMAK